MTDPHAIADLARRIEAVLLVASRPVSAAELAQACGTDPAAVDQALALLVEEFTEGRHGFALREVARRVHVRRRAGLRGGRRSLRRRPPAGRPVAGPDGDAERGGLPAADHARRGRPRARRLLGVGPGLAGGARPGGRVRPRRRARLADPVRHHLALPHSLRTARSRGSAPARRVLSGRRRRGGAARTAAWRTRKDADGDGPQSGGVSGPGRRGVAAPLRRPCAAGSRRRERRDGHLSPPAGHRRATQ